MYGTVCPVNLQFKEKQFDFSANKNTAINSVVLSDCVKSSKGFVATPLYLSAPAKITASVYFNNNLYVTCDNGYIYLYDTALRQACDYKVSSVFKMLSVKIDGETATIILSSSGSTVIKSGVQTDLGFRATDGVVYCGRLIYFCKNEIFVGKPYDYAGKDYVSFKVDESVEGFVGFYVLNGELFLIYRKHILKIPRFGDVNDIQIKYVTADVENVATGGMFPEGDKLYLFDKRKISCFDGKTIKTFKTLLTEPRFTVYSRGTGMYNGIIMIKATDRTTQKTYAYFYDTRTETEWLSDYDGTLLYNYSACVSKNNNLMNLSADGVRQVSYKSDKTDFGSGKLKTLYSLSVYVSAPTEITLYGDFGEKTFNLKAGFNRVFCNADTVGLSVSFSASAENYTMSDLKIKYTEKGE